MGTKLLPGKGGHFHLNQDVIDFLSEVTNDLKDYLIPAESTYASLDEALDAGEGKEAFENLKELEGWSYEKDKFGSKVYREMEFQTGTYRVTVVLNSQGSLKLDIRNWYDPEA